MPFDIYDASFRNVLKFTYGLLKDPSVLVQKICGDFLCAVEGYSSTTDHYGGYDDPFRERANLYESLQFRHILLDLQKERPDSPVNPLRNATVCYMNKYLPSPDQPSQLCFFEKYVEQMLPENAVLGKVKSYRSRNDKPCIVFMRCITSKGMRQLLDACSMMSQPIRSLYLHISAFAHEKKLKVKEICKMEGPALTFVDGAGIELVRCDCYTVSLQKVVASIKSCVTLQKLSISMCSNIPDELFIILGQMKHLKQLEIKNTKLTPEQSDIFSSSLLELTNLKIVHLSYSLPPSTDFLPLLRTLFSFPLQILNIDGLSLTGTVRNALDMAMVNLDHLQRLYLESCDLDDSDLLALGDCITANRFPSMCMVSLLGNDFSKMLASVEHFLERFEGNSGEVNILMDSTYLPEGLTQEKYSCLKTVIQKIQFHRDQYQSIIKH